MRKRGIPAFFLVFWAHSKAVSVNFKNEEEGHRASFLVFLGAFKSGALNTKMVKRGARFFFSFFGRIYKRSLNTKNGAERHRALVKHRDARGWFGLAGLAWLLAGFLAGGLAFFFSMFFLARLAETQLLGILQAYLGVIILQPHACTQRFRPGAGFRRKTSEFGGSGSTFDAGHEKRTFRSSPFSALFVPKKRSGDEAVTSLVTSVFWTKFGCFGAFWDQKSEIIRGASSATGAQLVHQARAGSRGILIDPHRCVDEV